MINLGLTIAEQIEFMTLLFSNHRLRIKLALMDLNQNYIGDLSRTFLDGQMSMDAYAPITRSLSLSLFDYSRSLQLAPDDPADGAAYPTRMIQCHYCVGRPDASKWYEVPIFTGPVNKADRDGSVLKVECQGKESLSDGQLWTGKTYQANQNKLLLICKFMAELGGEAFFDVTTSAIKTQSKLEIARFDKVLMDEARRLAETLGLHAFYDGLGNFRVRAKPKQPVIVIDKRHMVAYPQTGYSLENLINAAEVTGATPKGHKKPVMGKYIAPDDHPLSPESLKRGNPPVRRFHPAQLQDTDIHSKKEADARAKDVVEEGLLEAVDAAFPMGVVPGLEEFDLMTLRTDTYASDARLTVQSVPLLADGQHTIGYTQRVKASKLSMKLRRP